MLSLNAMRMIRRCLSRCRQQFPDRDSARRHQRWCILKDRKPLLLLLQSQVFVEVGEQGFDAKCHEDNTSTKVYRPENMPRHNTFNIIHTFAISSDRDHAVQHLPRRSIAAADTAEITRTEAALLKADRDVVEHVSN
jgi:hypothetical protein